MTIRLDESTVEYLKALSEEMELPYQSLINLYLRDCEASRRRLALTWRPVCAAAVERQLVLTVTVRKRRRRMICFWERARSTIYFLYVYPTNGQDNLTPDRFGAAPSPRRPVHVSLGEIVRPAESRAPRALGG